MNQHDVIVHIGLHKTATTALQQDYYPKLQGVNYLSLKNDIVRKYANNIIATDPIYYSQLENRKKIEDFLDFDKPNLISCEALSGPAWVGVSERGIDHRLPILQNLKHDFPDAKILLVIRRQDDFAKSMYRQYVKTGGTKSLREFYQGSMRSNYLFSPYRFQYSPYIDALHSLFGNNVCVGLFEQFQEDKNAFLARIADFIGVESPSVEIRKRNATKFGSKGLMFLRYANYLFKNQLNPCGLIGEIPIPTRAGIKWINSARKIHDIWPSGNGAMSNEDTQVLCAILDDCREDNMKLSNLIGVDMEKYGYI